jgi:fatty acid desaturase
MNFFAIAAMVVVGAVLLLGVVWGAPIFAVPLVLIGIAAFAGLSFYRRVGEGSRLGRFRGQRVRASAGRDLHSTGRAPEHEH